MAPCGTDACLLRRFGVGRRRGRAQDRAAILAQRGAVREGPFPLLSRTAITATRSARWRSRTRRSRCTRRSRGALARNVVVDIPDGESSLAELDRDARSRRSRAGGDDRRAAGAGRGRDAIPLAGDPGGSALGGRKHGVLFIADEIATGFWRTGSAFACDEAGMYARHPLPGQGTHGRDDQDGSDTGDRGDLRVIPERRLGDRADARPDVHGQPPGLRGRQRLARPVRARAESRAGAGNRSEPAVQGSSRAARCRTSSTSESKGRSASSSLTRTSTSIRCGPRFVDQGVWIRPFKDIVYLMPPLVISGEDLKTLTRAVCAVVGAVR